MILIYNQERSMGRKNNKYKQKSNQNQHTSSKIQVNEEELLAQCLQLHQLLKNRTAKLRALETGDFCYILSTKWLREWKEYVGYQKITSSTQQQESSHKKDKKYGRKHPGKINTDLMAPTSEVNQFYTIPAQMKEYQYLKQIISEKKTKDDDYIAVTQDIWFAFTQYYEAQEIRRPVIKLKSSTYYEGDSLRVETIIVNLQSEQLQEKIKKTPRKQYNTVFPSDKMLLPCRWTFEELETFLSEYCKYTYNHSKIRIWKGFSYVPTNPLIQNIVQSIKDKKYLVKGRLLTAQKYRDLDIEDFIKNTHALIVQIGEVLKTDDQFDDTIKGYCQECIEKKELIVGCMCHEVWYCSRKCRINDQTFHKKSCEFAFDSEDDQQYQKQSLTQIPVSGLDNLGNSCYMNCTIQAFLSLEHISLFMSSNQFLKYMNEKQIKENNCMFLRKFSKTVKGLIQEKESYAPWSLKSQIDYNLAQFKGDKQHDANDFLINFVNVFNDHLSKENDKAYHRILQPFIGEFHSLVICPLCNVKSENNQIFTQLSLPIISKPKKQTYNYCIVDSLNNITRGKANAFQNWKQIKANLGLKQNTLIFTNKQPEGLILIDQDEKNPQKTLKSLRGDLYFFKDLENKQDEYLFVTNLVSMKVICGSKMKSPYGVPFVISVNDIQKTLGTFWLQLIRTYFWHNQEIIKQATNMQTQYFRQIQEAVKKDSLQLQTSTQTKVQQKEGAQQKESQLCKKIVDNYNTKLKLFAQKIGIEVFLNDFKKSRNICSFCKKKCQGCELPKIFDKSFQDFFAHKYKQVRFEVYLRDVLAIQTNSVDFSSSGDPTLHDCLNLFNQPEQLDEENAWYCANCDNMALALKQMSVKLFPDILIIHLNRFKTVDGKKMKNSDPIVYNQFENFGGKDYRLVSVVVHEGSMQGGHYWSICLRENQYYVFNDSKVNKIEKVFNRNAYILIYRNVHFSM